MIRKKLKSSVTKKLSKVLCEKIEDAYIVNDDGFTYFKYYDSDMNSPSVSQNRLRNIAVHLKTEETSDYKKLQKMLSNFPPKIFSFSRQ